MAYKTIFTPVTDAEIASPALKYAQALCLAQDAHLDVMCIGIDRSTGSYYEVGANALIMQNAIEQAQTRAEAIRTEIKPDLDKAGILWGAQCAVASIPDAGAPASRAARFSDLAVAALPYGDKRGAEEHIVLEALLFNAAVPTLCVPEGAKPGMPDNVVIAWNESNEALRAVRAALPFLIAANSVHIAVIDPPTHGPDRSDPGGMLAVMLARHGVNCDIQVMTRSGQRVGDVLLRHITDIGADMLVMGGYGHSRFREAVLGGATRYMLEHASVPVLMAH